MKIYLIRHGETSWNTLGRLQGRTDIELNENGIRLAKITGEKLKDVHFDLAIASPLKRAYEPELEELGTWQQAVDYCRGKGDNWRLPTANELYYYWCVEPSVRVLDPFMEANYWSSTTNASNAGQAWTFDFGYGIANKKGKTERLYVRCVWDKESGAGTKYPYVKAEGDATLVVLRDAAGGLDRNSLFASRPTATLIDTKRSGNNRMSAMLQVQRADPGFLNWRPSIDYCDNLREEGYDDWRLPSQRELMMIWTMGGNEHVESLDIDTRRTARYKDRSAMRGCTVSPALPYFPTTCSSVRHGMRMIRIIILTSLRSCEFRVRTGVSISMPSTGIIRGPSDACVTGTGRRLTIRSRKMP